MLTDRDLLYIMSTFPQAELVFHAGGSWCKGRIGTFSGNLVMIRTEVGTTAIPLDKIDAIEVDEQKDFTEYGEDL